MKEYTTDKRIGFAIIDGTVVFQEDNNRINTLDWLKDQLNLSDEAIETTIRGGLFEDRITMCIGKDYNTVDMNQLSAGALVTIMDKQSRMFGFNCPVEVWNGSVVGEPGVAWEPIEIIGKGYLYSAKV